MLADGAPCLHHPISPLHPSQKQDIGTCYAFAKEHDPWLDLLALPSLSLSLFMIIAPWSGLLLRSSGMTSFFRIRLGTRRNRGCKLYGSIGWSICRSNPASELLGTVYRVQLLPSELKAGHRGPRTPKNSRNVFHLACFQHS